MLKEEEGCDPDWWVVMINYVCMCVLLFLLLRQFFSINKGHPNQEWVALHYVFPDIMQFSLIQEGVENERSGGKTENYSPYTITLS